MGLYSRTSLSQMTKLQRICPRKRAIRDNRSSFAVKFFEFTAFHTGQRGIRITEIRNSEVWLYFLFSVHFWIFLHHFMIGQRWSDSLWSFHFSMVYDISRLMVSKAFVAKCMVLKRFPCSTAWPSACRSQPCRSKQYNRLSPSRNRNRDNWLGLPLWWALAMTWNTSKREIKYS